MNRLGKGFDSFLPPKRLICSRRRTITVEVFANPLIKPPIDNDFGPAYDSAQLLTHAAITHPIFRSKTPWPGRRRRLTLMNKRMSYLAIVTIAFAAVLAIARTGRTAGKPAAEVKIVSDDIGGVVTSSKGPEAGVWVIAETKDLPTGYRKIVVTDDQGRYVIPELPKATYDVWVRGYGLVDSPKVKAAPGKMLNLTAVIASDPREAAQYYPAAYWYSLLHMPPKSDFPGTGENGNGISERIHSQAEWVEHVKTDGCESCHQLGDKATREFPKGLGAFDTSFAAWDRRIQSSQVGAGMNSAAAQIGRKRLLTEYADWTDRIKSGEVPPAPPRPQGRERNVVITIWDWSGQKDYFHDEITVDRWNPTTNPNGLVYGVHEESTDLLTILDPT